MKHIRILPLLLALVCTACHKDGNGFIELYLEPLGSDGSKLVVDNTTYTTATWSDGDIINFNGGEVAITRVDDHAYIQNVTSLSTNRACFPADLAANINRDNITITLPAVYHYRTSGGKQKVDMPLVARADDGSAMQFKHLTAALCLTIANQQGSTLAIDRITVTSDSYQLNGERSVDLSDIASFFAAASSNAANRTVTMLFDKEQLEVANDGSATVFIPVPPVGDGNHFTVTVTTHIGGTRHTYSKTQSGGGALARNVLAYAHQNLSGSSSTAPLFDGSGTVASPFLINDAVDFLNFVNACNNKWKLHENQLYDSILYYRMTDDIDMAGITISPIRRILLASFNGDNNSIKNLTVTNRNITTGGITKSHCGLFDSVTTSNISNLTLENLTLTDNSASVNTLYMGSIGCISSASTFDNCHIKGLDVTIPDISGTVELGGLVSSMVGNNTISNSSVDFSQTLSFNSQSSIYYGGLVAEGIRSTTYTLTFTNDTVVNTGLSISGLLTTSAGGLIGNSKTTVVSMTGCVWRGSMSFASASSALRIGGLIGYMVGGTNPGSLTAEDCTVEGSISGTSSVTCYVAAFVGLRGNATLPKVTFTNCRNNTDPSLPDTGN